MKVAAARDPALRRRTRPLALLSEVCYHFPEMWAKEGGGGGRGDKLMFTQGTIT